MLNCLRGGYLEKKLIADHKELLAVRVKTFFGEICPDYRKMSADDLKKAVNAHKDEAWSADMHDVMITYKGIINREVTETPWDENAVHWHALVNMATEKHKTNYRELLDELYMMNRSKIELEAAKHYDEVPVYLDGLLPLLQDLYHVVADSAEVVLDESGTTKDERFTAEIYKSLGSMYELANAYNNGEISAEEVKEAETERDTVSRDHFEHMLCLWEGVLVAYIGEDWADQVSEWKLVS